MQYRPQLLVLALVCVLAAQRPGADDVIADGNTGKLYASALPVTIPSQPR